MLGVTILLLLLLTLQICALSINGFMISNRHSASERLTSKLHEGEVCNNESYKTILN